MAARLRARPSLTRRLTVGFTTVAATVLLGLAILVLLATSRHFDDLDRAVLSDKRELITTLLREADSAADARMRLAQSLAFHQGLTARVALADDTMLYPAQPALAQAHAGHGDAPATPNADDTRRWRFTVATAWSDLPVEVELATARAHHSAFLRELSQDLVAYLLVSVLACGLLAWLAARRGLAPLRDMRTRAAAVSTRDLQGRMPVQAVPIEMADLAIELNGMLDRLSADFQRLNEVSSDLAHELRTPISNLLTQTQVVLSAPRSLDTYRDTLASNAEEFQRMGRMVADMLFLAKADSGTAPPRRERFDVRAEAGSLIAFYETLAQDKGVRIDRIGAGELVGDRLMLRRALANLLSNAARHVEQHGRIRVVLQQTEAEFIIAVENTGPDIERHELPRVFDRFFRGAHAGTEPGQEGAGLGLAITQAIVRAHGGRIEVVSRQGLTRFALHLPTE